MKPVSISLLIYFTQRLSLQEYQSNKSQLHFIHFCQREQHQQNRNLFPCPSYRVRFNDHYRSFGAIVTILCEETLPCLPSVSFSDQLNSTL